MIASLGAHLDQRREPRAEVLGLAELVADGLLGLGDVRGDDRRLRAQPGAHRLAVGVEQGGDAERAQLQDQLGVDGGLGARRQRSGDHAEVGAARQVDEPLGEALELVGA